MGLQHVEFYADFSSKEIFEKSAPKEVRPKNRFFWRFKIFAENPVFGIIFLLYIKQNLLSDRKLA
jgi:hypothetical protein